MFEGLCAQWAANYLQLGSGYGSRRISFVAVNQRQCRLRVIGSRRWKNNLKDLKDWEVTTMEIFADTASGSTACYKSSMQLRLYRLDFPRQNPAGLESKKELPEPAPAKRIALNALDFPESKVQ